MKKLMIAISAVSLAFGLRAADGVELPVGEAFEGSEMPATISNPGESTISTTSYSFSKEETVGAPDKFSKTDAGNNLAIKTPFGTPASWTVLGEGGYAVDSQLYFDSLVKFTACDEAPADTDIAGAKIVVWVKEEETDSGVTKTLMVTAGKRTSKTEVSRQDYACGTPSEYGIEGDDDWCRLTIKAVKDVSNNGSLYPGFVVFVNAKTVEIKDGKETGLADDGLAQNMKLWFRSNHLFPSLAAQSSVIAGVSFAGQGAVDDLVFTLAEPTKKDGGAAFAQDSLAPIAQVGTTECTDVDAINNAIVKAVAEATDATTVKLLDNVTGDLVFEFEATKEKSQCVAFTLDLNGKTLTDSGSEGECFAVAADGVQLTITDTSTGKNGKIDGGIYGDPKVILAAGKLLASKNEGWAGNVTVADPTNWEIKLDTDGVYFVLSEILENGTEKKPWLINSADDLVGENSKIVLGAAGAGVYYKMNADISIDEPFPGIGSEDDPFYGIFNGEGKTVKIVSFTPASKRGFFNTIMNATVSNLTVEVGGFSLPFEDSLAAADAEYQTGGGVIAGQGQGTSTIVGCTAKGFLYGTFNVSGIVGEVQGGTTIKDCTNYAVLTGAYSKVAGIVSYNEGGEGATVIENCVNRGSVVAYSVAGKRYESRAFAKVGPGSDGVAGIISWPGMPVNIKNCSNEGTLSALNEGAVFGSMLGKTGSVAVTLEGTNTMPVQYKSVGSGSLAAAAFATVENDIATLVPSTDVVAGGSYKVMCSGAPALAITLADKESIVIDTALASVDCTGIVAAENCKLTTTTEGTVTTYASAAIPAFSAITASATFGDEAVTVAVKAGDADVDAADYTLAYSPEYTATTAAGTEITVTATPTDTVVADKKYLATPVQYTFKVAAKEVTPEITLGATEAAWVDGMEFPTVAVEGYTLDTDYTCAWNPSEITKPTDETVTNTYTVTVTMQGNYTGSNTANFLVYMKAGPVIPEEQGTIDVDKDGNVNVTPAADVTEVNLSGVSEDATVTIPTSVEKIFGVTAEQVKITYTAAEAGAKTYDVTSAFIKDGDATEGVTYRLDPDGSVNVDGVTVQVTPTITEAASTEGTIADGAVATAAIPGLTYTLKRATSLATGADKVTADSEKAISGTVSLKDGIEGDKPAQAFYTIEVTK